MAENKLYGLLPKYFQDIENFFTLTEIENLEFIDLESWSDRVNSNNFIQTCDAPTLYSLKNLLGLIWFSQFDTEELREFVLAQMAERGPFSEKALRNMLSRIMEAAGFEVPDELEILKANSLSFNIRENYAIRNADGAYVKSNGRYSTYLMRVYPGYSYRLKAPAGMSARAFFYASGTSSSYIDKTGSAVDQVITIPDDCNYVGIQPYQSGTSASLPYPGGLYITPMQFFEDAEKGYTMTIYPSRYHIDFCIFSGRSGVLDVVKGLLHRWLPAHIGYSIRQVVKHTPSVTEYQGGAVGISSRVGIDIDRPSP